MFSVGVEQNLRFKFFWDLMKGLPTGRWKLLFDVSNFRAVAAVLNMLVHDSLKAQGLATVIEEDIILLLQQIHDDVNPLVANIIVSGPNHCLNDWQAKQGKLGGGDLYQKTLAVIFEILEWNVGVLHLEFLPKLWNEDV